ncbi:uncharacterized protein [Symphalangus syndactylus]|uniref:uncharacterized protein isoform X1 n=1 Tax=Symphalangus syndactylus TaxID=9590 RepID=UPI003006BC5A
MNEAQRHAALKVTQQVSEGGGVKPGPRLQQTANPKECSTQFWELPTPGSGRRSRHTPMCECSCNTRWKESCTGDYDTAVRTKKLTPHVSMEEQPQHGRRRDRVQGMSLEAGRPRRRLAQRRGDTPCSPRILDQGFEA